jgi:hypothetical protein
VVDPDDEFALDFLATLLEIVEEPLYSSDW